MAEGGRGASTPAQAVIGADVVVSVVVNAAQTEAVLFGQEGVAEAMAEGSVFVSSSTMDPAMARRLAKRLEAKGCLYLDAPISGGAQRAAEGALTILASGSPAAFAKAPTTRSSSSRRHSPRPGAPSTKAISSSGLCRSTKVR